MRLTRSFSIALFLPLYVAAAAQTSNTLLEQSYALSHTLSGSERVYYLSELTHIATQVEPPPGAAEDWCLTSFQVASAENDPAVRIAGQKNALADLSFFNPALSMSLFLTLEVEYPDEHGMLLEDLRSDAADKIFKNYLRKFRSRGLVAISAQARYLGQTGQYPYRAIANIASLLTKEEAVPVLNDALGFYRHETGFYNRDEEFLYFLQTIGALDGSPVNGDFMKQAIDAYVDRLQNDSIQFPGNYYSEIHTTIGAVVPFTDRNRAFLFRVFPLVRSFDPELATKLQNADQTLTRSASGMHYVSGGFVMGKPSSTSAAKKHQEWLQYSLLTRIKEQECSDPQAAVRFAQRLDNVKSRIIGFSTIVPSLASGNPQQARQLYKAQVSDFKVLRAPAEQAPAMVALARAANRLGEVQQYGNFSVAALNTAVSLVTNDTRGNSIMDHAGFADLKDLVLFDAGQKKAAGLSQQIDKLDGWLKAYLLLYEAAGQSNPAPAACSH
jgi:hypothetical protein